jgi:hypothetical protein
MATGRPRDEVRAQRWRERIERWELSGLTVRAFCRKAGLSQGTFFYWRRALAQRSAGPAAKAAALPRFVPVTIRPSPHSPDIEIQLPDGTVIRGTGEATPERLGQVAAALRAAAC